MKLKDDTFGANPETDVSVQYLMNALFTPVDMTEYEEVFSGGYYSSKPIPHTDADSLNLLHGNMDNYPMEVSEPLTQDPPFPNLGITRRAAERKNELKEAREALKEKFEEMNATEDEDEDEGDEEGEAEEEDELTPFEDGAPNRNKDWDVEKNRNDEEWPPKQIQKPQPRSEFFKKHETLKSKYNEVEIDAFLKLLNVKPLSNW